MGKSQERTRATFIFWLGLPYFQRAGVGCQKNILIFAGRSRPLKIS
jgi:hypothetical protein